MTIDFGLGLLFGPAVGQTDKWLSDIDASVSKLQGHFRSLWMTDHFFWQGEPTFEAFTVLSYLAGHFPDMEVGPMVFGQNYRNPALLALMAATLQSVSKGRFIMGIGAGWKEDEYRAYDYDFPSPKVRLEQLEDTLIIFKKLWSEPGQISYEGKQYKVVDAWCEPKPAKMIPILVGGGGATTMLHAARHADMWNLPDANINEYTDRLNILKRHLDTIGRDPSTMRYTWYGRLAIGKTQAEAEVRGNSRAEKYTKDNAFVGTAQQIIEQMAKFTAVGVDYFMLEIIDLPDEEVIGLVTEELMPKVQS